MGENVTNKKHIKKSIFYYQGIVNWEKDALQKLYNICDLVTVGEPSAWIKCGGEKSLNLMDSGNS